MFSADIYACTSVCVKAGKATKSTANVSIRVLKKKMLKVGSFPWPINNVSKIDSMEKSQGMIHYDYSLVNFVVSAKI